MKNKTQKPLELVGYHGTTREVANSIIQNADVLRSSKNGYDWLGSGIYFWVFNAERARLWAEQQGCVGTLPPPRRH